VKIGQYKITKRKIIADEIWANLKFQAQVYDDVTKLKVATNNRAGRLDYRSHDVEAAIAGIEAAHKVAKQTLVDTYLVNVPEELQAWQRDSPGVGEHTLARLLGTIGDPCIALPMWWEGTGAKRHLVEGKRFIRTVPQLWQYSGVGDSSRKRSRGMSAEEAMGLGNPDSKMLLYLMAESSMKGRITARKNGRVSPYGDLYDKLREEVADKEHSVECRRCGPSGKPKQPGTPWNPGHQMAHALRLVGKQMLADIHTIRLEAITS